MDKNKSSGTVKRKKKVDINNVNKQFKCENEFDTSIDYRKKLVSFYISKQNHSKSNINMFDKKNDLFADNYYKTMKEKSLNFSKKNNKFKSKETEEKLIYVSKNLQTKELSSNGFNNCEITNKNINNVPIKFSKNFPSVTKESKIIINNHHSYNHKLVSDPKKYGKIFDSESITSNDIKIVNKVPIVTIKKLPLETCRQYLTQYQKSSAKTTHPSKKLTKSISSIKNIHNKNPATDILVNNDKKQFDKVSSKWDQTDSSKVSSKKNQPDSKNAESKLTVDEVKNVGSVVRMNECNKETDEIFRNYVSSNKKDLYASKTYGSKDPTFTKEPSDKNNMNSEKNINDSSNKKDTSNSEKSKNKGLVIKIKKSRFRSSFDCLKIKFDEIMKDSNTIDFNHSKCLKDDSRTIITNCAENNSLNTEFINKRLVYNSLNESKTDPVYDNEINYPINKNTEIIMNASTFNAKLSKLFVKKPLMVNKNDFHNTNEAISSSENTSTISFNVTTVTNTLALTTPMYNTLLNTMNFQDSPETASITATTHLNRSFATDTLNTPSSYCSTYTDTSTVITTALCNKESITNTSHQPSFKICDKKSSSINKKIIKNKKKKHEKVKTNVDPKSYFFDHNKKYSSVKFQKYKKSKFRNKNVVSVNKENKTPDIFISKSSENPLEQHCQVHNESEAINNIKNEFNIKKSRINSIDNDRLYFTKKLPQCIELKHSDISTTNKQNLKNNIEASKLYANGILNKDLEPTYLQDVLNDTHSCKVDKINMQNKNSNINKINTNFKKINSKIHKYSLNPKSINNIDLESIKRIVISKIEKQAKILDSKTLNVSTTSNNFSPRLINKNDNLFESISSSLNDITTNYKKQKKLLKFQSSDNFNFRSTGSKNIVISNNNALSNHALKHNNQLQLSTNRTPFILTQTTHQRHPFGYQSWPHRFFHRGNHRDSYTLFRGSLNTCNQSQHFSPRITPFPHISHTNTDSVVSPENNQIFLRRNRQQQGGFDGHQQKHDDPHININFNFHYYDQQQIHNHYYNYQNNQQKSYNSHQQPIKLKLCFPQNTQNQQVVPPDESKVETEPLSQFNSKKIKYKRLNFNNLKLIQDESFFKKLNMCLSKLNKQRAKADCVNNQNALGPSQSSSNISPAPKTSEYQYKIFGDSGKYTLGKHKNRLKKYTKRQTMGTIETITKMLVKYKRCNYTFLKRRTKIKLSKTIKAKYTKQRINLMRSITSLAKSRLENIEITKIINNCSNESHINVNTCCNNSYSIISPYDNVKQYGYSRNKSLMDMNKKNAKHIPTSFCNIISVTSPAVSSAKTFHQEDVSSNQHETRITKVKYTNKTSTSENEEFLEGKENVRVVELTNNLNNENNEEIHIDTAEDDDEHVETCRIDNGSYEENDDDNDYNDDNDCNDNDDDGDDDSDNDVNDTADDELEDVLSQKIDNEILRRCSVNSNSQFSTLKRDFSSFSRNPSDDDNSSVDNCSSYSSENEEFLEEGKENVRENEIVGSVNSCFNQYENGFLSVPSSAKLPADEKYVSRNFLLNKDIDERDLVFSYSKIEGNIENDNRTHIKDFSESDQYSEQNNDKNFNNDNSNFENTKAFLSKIVDEEEKSNCSFIHKCEYSEESDFENVSCAYHQANNKEDVRNEKNTENIGIVKMKDIFDEELQGFPILTPKISDKQITHTNSRNNGYLETFDFGVDYYKVNDDNINETSNINEKYFENSTNDIVSCEKDNSIILHKYDRNTKKTSGNNVLNSNGVTDQVSHSFDLNKFNQGIPQHMNIEDKLDYINNDENQKQARYKDDVKNFENKNESYSRNFGKYNQLNFSTDDTESINDNNYNPNDFENNINIEERNKIKDKDKGLTAAAEYSEVSSPKRGKLNLEIKNISKNDACGLLLQIGNNLEDENDDEPIENMASVGFIGSDVNLNVEQKTDNNLEDSSAFLHVHTQLRDIEFSREHEKIISNFYDENENKEFVEDIISGSNKNIANNSNNETIISSIESHNSEITDERIDKGNDMQNNNNRHSPDIIFSQYKDDSDIFERNSKPVKNVIYEANMTPECKELINNNIPNIGISVNEFKNSINSNVNVNESMNTSFDSLNSNEISPANQSHVDYSFARTKENTPSVNKNSIKSLKRSLSLNNLLSNIFIRKERSIVLISKSFKSSESISKMTSNNCENMCQFSHKQTSLFTSSHFSSDYISDDFVYQTCEGANESNEVYNNAQARTFNNKSVLNSYLNNMQNVSIDIMKDKNSSMDDSSSKSRTIPNNNNQNLKTAEEKLAKVDEKNDEVKDRNNDTIFSSDPFLIEDTNTTNTGNCNEVDYSDNLNSEELVKSCLYQIIDEVVDDIHRIRETDLKVSDEMCYKNSIEIDRDEITSTREVGNKQFDGLYEDVVVAVEDYSSIINRHADTFGHHGGNQNGVNKNNSLKMRNKTNRSTKWDNCVVSIENMETLVNNVACKTDEIKNDEKPYESNNEIKYSDVTEVKGLTKEKMIGAIENKSPHKKISKKVSSAVSRLPSKKSHKKVYRKRKNFKSIDNNGSKEIITKLHLARKIAKPYLAHFKKRVEKCNEEKLDKRGIIEKSLKFGKKLKKNKRRKTFISNKNITVESYDDNDKLNKNISLDEKNAYQKSYLSNDIPEKNSCEIKENIVDSTDRLVNNNKKDEIGFVEDGAIDNVYEIIDQNNNANISSKTEDKNHSASVLTNNCIEEDNDSQARQEIDMAVESILSEDYFSKFHENTEYQPLNYTFDVLTETNDLVVDANQNTKEYNIGGKELSINITEDSTTFCEEKIDSTDGTNVGSVKTKSPRNKNIISNNNSNSKSNLKFLKSFKSKWFMLHKKGKDDSSFSPEKQQSPIKITTGDSTRKERKNIKHIDKTIKKYRLSNGRSILLQNTSLVSKYYRRKLINKNLKKLRKRIFKLKTKSTNNTVHINKLAQTFGKSIFFKSRIRPNFKNENCLYKIFSKSSPSFVTTFFVFQPLRPSFLQSCLSIRDQNLLKLSTHSNNQHQKLPKINKKTSLNSGACLDNEIKTVSLNELDKYKKERNMDHQKSRPSCKESTETNFSPDISCIISAAIKSSFDPTDFYPKEENLLNQPHQNQSQPSEFHRPDNSIQKHTRENNYPLYHYPTNINEFSNEFPCRFEISATPNKEPSNARSLHELLNTRPSYKSVDTIKYAENNLNSSQLPLTSKHFSFDNSLLLPHSLNQKSSKRNISKANCISLKGNGLDNKMNREKINTSHNYNKASGGHCYLAKNLGPISQSNNLSINSNILPPWNPNEMMNFYKNSSHNLCLGPTNLTSSSNHIIKPMAVYEPMPVKPVFHPPSASNPRLLDSFYRHYSLDQNQPARFKFPPNLLRPISRPYYRNLDPKNFSYQNNHLINVKNPRNYLPTNIPLDQNNVSLIDFSPTRLHHPNIANKTIYPPDYSHFPLTHKPHNLLLQNNASNCHLKFGHNQTSHSSSQYGEQSELNKVIKNSQTAYSFPTQSKETSIAPAKDYYSKKKRMLSSFYNNEALLHDKFNNYHLNNLLIEDDKNKNLPNTNIPNVPRPTPVQYDKIDVNLHNTFFHGNPGNSSQTFYRPSCMETHYK